MKNRLAMNSSVEKITFLVLKVIIGVASIYYIGLFLYIGLSRFAFPITFDWVEGAVLVQVNRILQGQKIYVEPGAAYIPLVYQPIYFYFAAAFAKIFGVSLGSARFLSILASCGCGLLIFGITRKIAGSSYHGLFSVGLFAATNGIVWTWFDFAKVDMLYILFSLLGLLFLVRADFRGALLAGMFFTLSFFTKQSALIIILPAFIFYFLINRKCALIFLAVTIVLSSIGILLLNSATGGWYYFYTFTLPSYHRLDTSFEQVNYVLTSLLKPILPFIGLVLFSILFDLRKFFRDRLFFFFFGVAASTLVLSVVTALSIGTTRNAFIPAYALLTIVFGLGLKSLVERIAAMPRGHLRSAFHISLIAISLLQFSLLQYNPREYIPSGQDFKRANTLIKYLRDSDDEFLLPSQNYLALMVQKKVFYHQAPLGEFTGQFGKTLPQWPRIQAEIRSLVHSGQVGAVYLTEPQHLWFRMYCEKEETFRSQSKYVPTLYKMKCN